MAQTDMDRLDELLAGYEKRIRDAFRDFIELVGADKVIAQIMAMLERSQIDDALAIVDSFVARLADALPTLAVDIGGDAASELSAMLPDVAMAISFDPSNERAARLMRQSRLRFVREFSAGQRQAVAQAFQRALREGAGAQDLARQIRSSIGLTGYQERIVDNYRRNLMDLDRDALDRVLRDRRSDSVVQRAIEAQRPLTPRQIDSLVERYRRRWLAMRAETIARTEGTALMAEMRDEALEQMAEQTGIDRRRISRIWNATRDKRVREFHESMQQQRRAMDEYFIDGLGNRLIRPGDKSAPAETTINCRCTLSFSIAPSA